MHLKRISRVNILYTTPNMADILTINILWCVYTQETGLDHLKQKILSRVDKKYSYLP